MNFQVFRVKDRRQAQIIDGLKPFLIPGEEFGEAETMIQELKTLLETAAELCYFSVCVNPDGEKDEDIPLSFVLAYVRPGTSVVVLLQFWTRELPGVSRNRISEKMFELFTNWCELNELTSIICDTSRQPATQLESLGFKVKTVLYVKMTSGQISLPPEKEPSDGTNV